MVSLLFGLPLLTGYTYVDSGFYVFALIPYLIAVVSIALLLLYLAGGRANDVTSIRQGGAKTFATSFISGFNSVSVYVIMTIATVMVTFYLAMRILILSAYPYPPPSLASLFGGAYVVLLIAVSVMSFPRIIYHAFPVVALVLKERKYALLAIILSVSFAIVYLLLVEQIVIIGYNEPSGVPPPAGQYPFLNVFTVGPRELLVGMVYLPYVLIQINPFVTIFVVPFEAIFAVLLSSLTSASVVLGYYLVGNSGLRCCARETTFSTGASILGLTATCPTCLVPSFVSVIFGGITAAEAAYSNVYGAVLPPMLSVAALLLSLVYLSRKVKSQTNICAGRVDRR
ncbi:MAG: hypothetical protein KGI38_03730 [Thaumarchaeota archaeon]|nr:hypothetical protein [Nitrososphaerota archaeon]